MVVERTGVVPNEYIRKAEIYGRLFLWAEALGVVRSLIHLSRRAEAGTTQANLTQNAEWHRRDFLAFCERHKLRPNTSSARVKFDESYWQPFPTITECYRIKDALLFLAVVIFGQIFKYGKKAEGFVSANKAMKDIREIELKEYLISRGISSDTYDDIMSKLKELRDNQLSHRVGETAHLRLGVKVSTHKMIGAGIEEIDFDLLDKVAVLMTEFVTARIRHLKAELDPFLSDFPAA